MNILIITPGGIAQGGGIGTVARNMYVKLQSHTIVERVAVIDSRGEKGFWLSFAFMLFALCKTFFYLAIWDGKTVVHINVSERFSFHRKRLFIQLAKVFGQSVVLHHHGAEFIQCYEKGSPTYRKAVQACINSADSNIVLGNKWLKYFNNNVEFRKPVSILYNAVPRLKIKKDEIAADTINLSLLANLSNRKGVHIFLEALSNLKSKYEFHATLVGGGEVQKFKSEASTLGISDRCTFTGWLSHDEAMTYLVNSDITVLPSFDEGLPMTLLEALSAGVPMICTKVGSIGEVFSNNKNCLFVDVGNVESLKNAIARLISEPNFREELSKNGRTLYDEMFTLDAYINRLIEHYQKVIGK
ncbi:glycosyltransferase family 4 protein [Alteromonas gracilis]|uniref:glycosyltransferase family 4 protein n=1 Tax=Alteromonas gracilis TaxID=1479524 RepID=UPI0036F29522